MSDFEPTSLEKRVKDLKVAAQSSHDGIYLTGPGRIELLSDELPASSFDGSGFLLASFGNCRCASDAKAIRQFDTHARVPSGVSQIALGHETLQLILEAPVDSSFNRGDVVVITPGHASEPINPLTFEPEKDGVLAALGYSYQHLGGLRRFNTVPANAPAFVSGQGFGNLFNKVSSKPDTSLISLAHAEPFACNYGTNKHVFTIGEDGGLPFGNGEDGHDQLDYRGQRARWRTTSGGLRYRFAGQARSNGRIRPRQGFAQAGNESHPD
jgi:hypothetical protein